jgi:indoleamine 2,3-dioxygenase
MIIPKLEDYEVDVKTGFLPPTPPLRRLTAYFESWELVLDDLNSLLLAGKLRDKVRKV